MTNEEIAQLAKEVDPELEVRFANEGLYGQYHHHPEGRYAVVPASPEHAVIALHELGHAAYAHRGHLEEMWTGSQDMTRREAEAWLWAIDRIGRPLHAFEKAHIASAMSTYLQAPLGWVGPGEDEMLDQLRTKVRRPLATTAEARVRAVKLWDAAEREREAATKNAA
jgi:hypothetical protein